MSIEQTAKQGEGRTVSIGEPELYPDPLDVGGFLAVYRGNQPQSDAARNSDSHRITRVLIQSNSDVSEEVAALRFPSAEICICSAEELSTILSRQPYPAWLRPERNVSEIEAGRYLQIRPVTAEVVPTLNCCFRCSQCSYRPPKDAEGVWRSEDGLTFAEDSASPRHHMTVEVMDAVLEALVNGGVSNILFTGGGEPMANYTVLMHGLQRATDLRAATYLYTNGFLLSPTRTAEVLAVSPRLIRISIYGTSPSSFARYTGKKEEGYERVLRNVAELVDANCERQGQTLLALSFIVHPVTMSDIDGLSESLLANLGEDRLRKFAYIRFTPAVDYYGGSQHDRRWMTDVFAYIEQELTPQLRGIAVIEPYRHRLRDLYNPEKPYPSCLASGWFAEVAPNGDAYLCCETMFNRDFLIGNLLRDSLEQIYAGDCRKTILASLAASHCKGCPPVCKPHEFNKTFARVEALRAAGRMQEFAAWREAMDRLHSSETFFPGLNVIES